MQSVLIMFGGHPFLLVLCFCLIVVAFFRIGLSESSTTVWTCWLIVVIACLVCICWLSFLTGRGVPGIATDVEFDGQQIHVLSVMHVGSRYLVTASLAESGHYRVLYFNQEMQPGNYVYHMQNGWQYQVEQL